MQNINVNEVYKELKTIVKGNYHTFDISIDNKGKISFKCYMSLNVIESESFKAPTPEDLFTDIKHWLECHQRKSKDVDYFNINICKNE